MVNHKDRFNTYASMIICRDSRNPGRFIYAFTYGVEEQTRADEKALLAVKIVVQCAKRPEIMSRFVYPDGSVHVPGSSMPASGR